MLGKNPMNPLTSIAIQFGIIFVPVLLFTVLKKKIAAKPMRLACALFLTLICGICVYYLASEYGWRPIARSGKFAALAPSTLSAIYTVSLMLMLTVISFAKAKNQNEKSA